ncbi:MAG: glutamine synthetase adenylyltransferase [Calditrichia bacterium]
MTKNRFTRLTAELCAKTPDNQRIAKYLQTMGFEDWRAASASLNRLMALETGRSRLKKLLPTILGLLEVSASPDRSLINVEHLLGSSKERSALLELLQNSPRTLDMLFTIFAGSQFLTDIVFRNPDYVKQLADARALSRPKSRDQFFREAMALQQEATGFHGRLDALRRYQRQQLWRIGASDLCNLSALQTVTSQLSFLAMGLIRACLNIASNEVQIQPDGFCVLALGKLGGRELNYSSDIDLIFISTGEKEFQRLGQKLIEALNKFTGEGFLYRTDMRLRPWGTTGALVPSVDDNLQYLRDNARLWEKQAMLKARIVAGDRKPGELFYRGVRELIFDLPAKEVRASVIEMKEKIEKKLNKKEWGEVKNGKGSIRDIEFSVQFLQLLNGGNSADIRSRNTLDALGRLAANSYLSMRDYRTLSEGYVFLRTIEHHLQIMHYLQTHQLPSQNREIAFLARRLGFEGSESGAQFLERYRQHRQAIRETYERLVRKEGDTEYIVEEDEVLLTIADLKTDDLQNSLMLELSDSQPVKVDARLLKEGIWQVTIVGYDYPGELSLICGLLSGFGLNILEGRIQTFEDKQPRQPALRSIRRRRPNRVSAAGRKKIADVFLVRQMNSDVSPDWLSYQNELLELVQLLRERETNKTHGKLASRLAATLEHSELPDVQQLPVFIGIDNAASESFTVLRIDAEDSFGFLYELTNALALHGLNISRMQITSLGSRVHDTLYVTDLQKQKLLDPVKQLQVRAVVALVKHFTQMLPLTPNPEAAMLHFREFLTHFFALPNWLAELSSLERPEVFDALIKLLGISDFLWSDFLRTQHDNLFPVVRDIQGLHHAKSALELQVELDVLLADAGTYAEKRSVLNAFKDREMFRIDMRYIQGFIPEFWQFSEELTDLSGVVLCRGLDMCNVHLTALHGEPLKADGAPARACVVALGKFGGRELGFASDIELMVVYEGDGETRGNKVITTPEYYDRLVLEIKQTIKAKREGIFEIDLRLRPYGKAGRMAVELQEFSSYFASDGPAWNYERQALVKLRPIWQDQPETLFDIAVLEARDECLFVSGAFDIAAMHAIREKHVRQLVAGGTLNAKYSPGGLVDVEYLVQGLQILHGVNEPELRHPNTGKAMKRLAKYGCFTDEQYAGLKAAHTFLRTLIDALRMVRGNARDLTVPSVNTKAYTFLARRLNMEETVLQDDIQRHTTWLRDVVKTLLIS